MEIDICPRWVLGKLGLSEQCQHHVSLFASALLALPLLLLAIHLPHFCLMRTVLGIPCPGCGVSHSILAILRLDPVQAWAANPAGVGVAVTFCFQLVARPIAIIVPRFSDLVSQASRHISNVALGGLLLVWISRAI
jgi:quinol-cytochrome oxidoreductase complex cytochrome b subunit